MANPQADLGALAVRRVTAGITQTELRLPRRWFSRVILPLLLIGGFASVLAWASLDRIFPPLQVKVIPVQVRDSVQETSGQELFKANGWIEPRPLPIDVPIQTEGMYRIKAVHVNPGEHVKPGQLLVLLDDEKVRLDLESAENKVARRKATLAVALADISKAQVNLNNAEVSIGLAKAEGEAEVRLELSEIKKAEVRLASAEFLLKAEELLVTEGVRTGDITVKKTRQLCDVARAELESAKARLSKARTVAEVRIRQAETARATAAAELVSQKAKHQEAVQEAVDLEVDVRKVKLELDRTRICSPVDGVVMQLHARVGFMMGGKSTSGDRKEAVVTLYDPNKLQVRVEVPITKFQFIRNGQPAIVEIEDVLPGKVIHGTVLYDTHMANIARNSVPVKVALPDQASPQLRPEMIASVRFIAPGQKEQIKKQSVERYAVPRRLLQWEGEQARIWVVNQMQEQASLQTIQLAPGEKDKNSDWVEIVSGVQPTDKLIATGLEQLKPGTRIKIIGEDR